MAGAPEPSQDPAPVQSTVLRCEGCGAPWTMRGFQTTRTAACEHCGSVFDTSGERWQLVQKVHGAYDAKPVYALGTRGRLDGIEWEVIGWVERSVTSWGKRYPWEEHLLYNPYEGFRYLMVQDGHFVLVETLPGLPHSAFNRATYEDKTYKHFSTADATVDQVLGEFPWEVRRGDVAAAADYVAPPRIISSEQSEGELVWSGGRYLEREEVIKAFGRPTRRIGAPRGIHPCQPNPHDANAAWMGKALAAGLALWLFMSGLYLFTRDSKTIWSQAVPAAGISSKITVDGWASRAVLQVNGRAPVGSKWSFLNCVLVNPATEKASYIPLDLHYGSSTDSVTVSGIPKGEYLLKVTPDASSTYKGDVHVSIVRDVPLYRWPCCSVVLLFVIPLFVFIQRKAFESSRWRESDHSA